MLYFHVKEGSTGCMLSASKIDSEIQFCSSAVHGVENVKKEASGEHYLEFCVQIDKYTFFEMLQCTYHRTEGGERVSLLQHRFIQQEDR